MIVFVVNCGSSSIKYQLFDMTDESIMAKGLLEKIGEKGSRLLHQVDSQSFEIVRPVHNHEDGLRLLVGVLTDPQHGGVLSDIGQIAAVGHRVVHGAEQFVASCLIDDEVIAHIEECADLAPLHNPPNLAGIRAAMHAVPGVPQVAVFDTAFHQTIPMHAYLYALPYDWYRNWHVRRYGFHGTSHRYVAGRAAAMLKKPEAETNVITCHLGNGCSMAAVREGHPIDTSMGLTPLEGLVMGTRSGDFDPAIIFFLAERKKMSLADINTALQKKSGLLGLSGVSNDMRNLTEAAAGGNEQAKLAIEVFAYRVRKYIGAYAAAMGKLDAVVFTGGIGENARLVRRLICQGLEILGIHFDAAANESAPRGVESDIAAAGSKVRLLVIPTNEEIVIARDTRDLATGA
jgi:acetate kinase